MELRAQNWMDTNKLHWRSQRFEAAVLDRVSDRAEFLTLVNPSGPQMFTTTCLVVAENAKHDQNVLSKSTGGQVMHQVRYVSPE